MSFSACVLAVPVYWFYELICVSNFAYPTPGFALTFLILIQHCTRFSFSALDSVCSSWHYHHPSLHCHCLSNSKNHFLFAPYLKHDLVILYLALHHHLVNLYHMLGNQHCLLAILIYQQRYFHHLSIRPFGLQLY